VSIPLSYQGELVGSLGMTMRNGPRDWTDDEVALITMVGQVVNNALQRRRYEEEREVLQAQLRQSQKMEAVGQLAGGVAHDFNNLLQVINGYTEMAMDTIDTTDSTHESLQEVARASDRATTLVRQLLTFGRRETVHPENVSLNDIIADLMKMLRRVIGEHLELEVDAGSDLKHVFADPGQMEQILMNLCVNARDAMPGGGKITIRTHNVTIDRHFTSASPWAREGEFVVLSVKDTGEGIDPEVQERVFEPFFTTKEVGKGTGLGLATVYAIAERHNGFVHLESTPGMGTAFFIYLPVAEKKATVTSVAKTDAAGEGQGETILLAEDDDLVRDLTIRILTRAGYQVIVAKDGDEAVAQFHKNRDSLDLAMVDMVMPKRSGREVFDAIRRYAEALPVLFSSGYGQDDLGGEPITGNNVSQIQKPFKPAELLRAVQQLLAVAAE